MVVCPLSKIGKFDNKMPNIIGHTGAIFDCDFNPFHEQLLATGSDDCSAKVWGIPDGGLTENLREPLVDLNNHMKKVTFTSFHPCANNGKCGTVCVCVCVCCPCSLFGGVVCSRHRNKRGGEIIEKKIIIRLPNQRDNTFDLPVALEVLHRCCSCRRLTPVVFFLCSSTPFFLLSCIFFFIAPFVFSWFPQFWPLVRRTTRLNCGTLIPAKRNAPSTAPTTFKTCNGPTPVTALRSLARTKPCKFLTPAPIPWCKNANPTKVRNVSTCVGWVPATTLPRSVLHVNPNVNL